MSKVTTLPRQPRRHSQDASRIPQDLRVCYAEPCPGCDCPWHHVNGRDNYDQYFVGPGRVRDQLQVGPRPHDENGEVEGPPGADGFPAFDLCDVNPEASQRREERAAIERPEIADCRSQGRGIRGPGGVSRLWVQQGFLQRVESNARTRLLSMGRRDVCQGEQESVSDFALTRWKHNTFAQPGRDRIRASSARPVDEARVDEDYRRNLPSLVVAPGGREC